MDIKLRHNCRICSANRLTEWVRLPLMPLTDDFRLPKEGGEFLYDLCIYYCPDCHTSQTLHDIDLKDYYRNYTYTVADSKFGSQFMSKLAAAVYQKYRLPAGISVIEVGSGNGSQLDFFRQRGARVFGFEPSRALCAESIRLGVPVYPGLFTVTSAGQIPLEFTPADLLLLTYTFDHIPEPVEFLKAAKNILKEDTGLLIIEVHDLEKIIERREYCLFAHEHYTYFSRHTLRNLLHRYGFKIVSSDLVPEKDRRGNSLLIVAALHNSIYAGDKTSTDINIEQTEDPDYYLKFNSQMQKGIKRLDSFVDDSIKNGKRIAGFGAGGRGVMTLAAMNSGGKLSYLCDNNPGFYGRVTPKSHVPVVPPKRLNEDRVDLLLIFSYGYMDEISQQVSSISNKGIQSVSLLELL